uniref:PB1-like domain-containing protein n=1 Tax=Medicago truncatula TaxID=3880 RepID=A2Q5N6_MEDTR|nr:hypothetical protein MtrDRAFT_AC167711g43v2 [Medicago truncatula]
MVRFDGDTLRGCPEIEVEDSHGGGFTAVFFTKGFFVRNPKLQYFGGEVRVFKGLDPERWSLFRALGHAKELDKRVESNGDEGVKLWWKPSNIPLDECLKKLSLDVHALELAKFAVENLEEVDIYVDYNTTTDSGNDEYPKCLEGVELYGVGASKLNDKGKGIAHEVEEAPEYESSDSEFVLNNVHFNDSEKDQMFGEEDGFEGDELIEGFGGVEHNERETVDKDCQDEVNAIIAFSTVDEHENAIENAYMTNGLDTTQPMSSTQIVDNIDNIDKKVMLT